MGVGQQDRANAAKGLLALALGKHRKGELDQAESGYSAVLALGPVSDAGAYADALHLLGVLHGQRGDVPGAIALVEQAIAANPRFSAYHNNLGNLRKRAGYASGAEQAYRRALTLDSCNAEAHLNLGKLLAEQGVRSPEARACYVKALRLTPRSVEVQMSMGRLEEAEGDLPAAIARFREAARLAPQDPAPALMLGRALTAAGDLDQAEISLRRALSLDRGCADAHYNLGVLAQQQKRLTESAALYRRAIELAPTSPEAADAWNNLGVVLAQQGERQAAMAAYLKATELRPDFDGAFHNLGKEALKLGAEKAAEKYFRRAIELNPGNVLAWHDLGALQQAHGWLDEATESYRRALESMAPGAGRSPVQANLASLLGTLELEQGRLAEADALYAQASHAGGARDAAAFELRMNFEGVRALRGDAAAVARLGELIAERPDHAEGHFNWSMALLLHGQYEAGWREYEWRREVESLRHNFPAVAVPMWDGSPLAGRTLLLRAEQGFGDTLQFARYLPLVAERGGRVILEVQPALRRLLQGLPGVSECIAQGDPIPDADVYLPLMSLPRVFETTADTIPPPLPLPMPASAPPGPGCRVGLVWAGNPGHARDRLRSVSLELLRPLAEVPGVRFISLQTAPAAAQMEQHGAPFAFVGDCSGVRDFADTAEIVAGLDLVITIDSAVAHLAASLGKPTWMLLANAPDWRWGLDTRDTPWYPTARLFRQARSREWAPVIAEVASALGEFVRARMTEVMPEPIPVTGPAASALESGADRRRRAPLATTAHQTELDREPHFRIGRADEAARLGVGKAAEFDFDSLKAHVAALAAKQWRDYTPASALAGVFTQAIERVSVVSFDIFDTAVIRYVDHPADVFLHLEQHPALAAHTFRVPVARLRITAESTARAMVHKLIASTEANLLEIYQVFCDLAGIAREHAPAFVAAEEQIELALCLPNPPIEALYREARAAGKEVIFVSDTYHTQEFLPRLLRSCGYDASEQRVFASSAARKSKQSGELLPLVLASLALEPDAVVHLGDHPVSDCQRAREAGITAILHAHKACRDELTLTAPEQSRGTPEQHGGLATHSFVRGMVHATPQAAAAVGREHDFWWKLGYSAAGPLTTGFCQWLEQNLRRDGVAHTWFMLRDGALLHRVYQALYADQAPCPSATLPTSRRAALLPVLEAAPSFALPSLLGGIGMRPVREYLDRLGIDARSFAPEATTAGFSSLDQQIDGRYEMTRLVRLLLQPRVINALMDRCRAERATLSAFLHQEGVTRPGTIALVDLGWSGTVQKSLHLLLGQIAPETRVIGYYLATFPESPHSVVPGLEVRAYLAHRGQPREVYQTIVQFLNLFEIVYSSPEGSVLCFEQNGERVVPVRQPADKSEAQCRHLEAIHDGAVAFAEEYRRRSAPLRLPPISPEAAAERFFRVVLQPTPEEARLLGETVHCDNLGSASQHVSARLEPGTDPAALIAAYEQAHWKQGLLAQATPETAALRTLLWLTTIEASEWAS